MRSVVVGEQYSRLGHSDIHHGRIRLGGCFPGKLSQQPSEQSHRLLSLNKSINSNGGITGHCASVLTLTDSLTLSNLKKIITDRNRGIHSRKG